ncbi:hypothetical protein AHAS_Ahas16G0235300 [Arachis hypogaea]
MQTMKIPTTICSKIDKICRDFLWGNNEEDRKVHLLNWDKVCKLRRRVDLVYRKPRRQTNSFL